jgi:sugar-specific transcriptional regulator TrmB
LAETASDAWGLRIAPVVAGTGGRRIPINPERVAKLVSLGLNEQQARAYLALLDVESATVNDLAKASRVPRAKLYEVVDGLNRKGLLDVIPTSPQRVRANPLTALYDTRSEELRGEERQLKRTIGELMLQLLPKTTDVASETERDFLLLSRGRTVYVAAVRQILERTQKRLCIVGDPLFLARLRLHEDLLQLMGRAAGRGQLQILVPANVVTMLDGRRVHVDELADVVRVLPFQGGDGGWMIRDESEVLEVHFLPNDLHPSRGNDRVIVNRDAELAAVHARLFAVLWERASPLRTGMPAPRTRA